MGALALIKSVPKSFVKACGKVAMKASKNKPQIMVFTGVIVATGGFIWGLYNAATKLNDTLSRTEEKVDEISSKKAAAEDTQDHELIVQVTKELRMVKFDAAWQVFKLVGIPSLMFVGGMTFCVGGHLILVRRFGELSTAFATLQQTFERYRQMNIKEHGEECDRRYRYGVVGDTTAEATITDKNGKEKTVKCKVPVVDPDQAASMYSFIFSEETSRRAYRDPILNISFLKSQEKYWNTWMTANHKVVTLYMVLEELGITLDSDDPRNDYIMIAGWRPNGDGDNHIDFGIMRAINQPALRQEENVIFLNFNCDGNLYHSPRYDQSGMRICG